MDKQRVFKAFVEWQIDYRHGNCISHEEADAMDINERAAADTEAFLEYYERVRMD